MPTTWSVRIRGMAPAGVKSLSGTIKLMRSPTCAPTIAASCAPKATPKLPGFKPSMLPATNCFGKSDTLPSSLGKMPRIATPRIMLSRLRSPWELTMGATPTTWGWAATLSASGSQFAKPSGAVISTWDRTESIRSRTSFWKPFMTERTTISEATPKAMPAVEIPEIKDRKPSRLPTVLRRLDRV